MTLPSTARKLLRDQVVAAGLAATTDPRAVVLPGVLVGVPQKPRMASGCLMALPTPVHLIVPPPGDDAAVDWLLDHLPTVLAAVGTVEAEIDTITVAGQTDCPCYTTFVPATVNLDAT